MNCGSYAERDVYRNSNTGLYIVLGARSETARDAPAYLRTNIPAPWLTVRGLGEDFTAPIYSGFVHLPRPIPPDFHPHVRPQVVIICPDYGLTGGVLYGSSCAALTPVDKDYAYPWPWVWSLFSDDFVGRFGTPPRNVPVMEICRRRYVIGWFGGPYWQALPMNESVIETKGGGGYLVATAASLGGYQLPAENKKTLISPPVPSSSLPYLRTALHSFGFWLRDNANDYERCETENVSIESEGGNYFLKITIIWHI